MKTQSTPICTRAQLDAEVVGSVLGRFEWLSSGHAYGVDIGIDEARLATDDGGRWRRL